jgi:Uma2 family endonuclease
MTISARFTSKDLDWLPTIEGIHFEIVDGVLFGWMHPHWKHQYATGGVVAALSQWNHETGIGIAVSWPGLVFSEDNDVIPDAVWISRARLAAVVNEAGHLTAAPELVVEVLSPGREHERRDREIKLELYALQGVSEYWIVDWQRQVVEVYCRVGDDLVRVSVLNGDDAISTPLLPGFVCPLERLWAPSL